MRNKSIVVIGSSNTDMVVKSSRLPAPGETVVGGIFSMNPGGKGANQAVAAARLGGNVTFIARVGADAFGQQSIIGFEAEGIDISYVRQDEEAASGIALIMVDDPGENCISVALGANAAMVQEDIDDASDLISDASYMLIQLEIPIEVVQHAVRLAHKLNVAVVLNPAPAQELSDEILKSLEIITPNETEAELLTGIKVIDEKTALEASRTLHRKGVKYVLITMGAKGVFAFGEGINQMIPCPRVDVVDTTAAGDTFNGALVVALSEGMTLRESITFANRAASISVTRMGAQPSVPTREELKYHKS